MGHEAAIEAYSKGRRAAELEHGKGLLETVLETLERQQAVLKIQEELIERLGRRVDDLERHNDGDRP